MDAHILSADEIWAADDIKEDTVAVPQWGGSVRIRALTLKQIAGIAAAALKRNPRTGQDDTDRETIMMMTLIEGMIEPKLTMADAQRLGLKSATAVTSIVQAINALGPTDEAIAEATKSAASESNGSLPVLPGEGVEDDTFRVIAARVDN